MSYPFRKQHLQLLYPGRILTNQYHYTGDNIPNEDMEGLQNTRDDLAALGLASRMEMEAIERHLGGKDKIIPHPAVEPEAPNEDPALTSLNILDTSDGLNPNLKHVSSPLDHLRFIDREADLIADDMRDQARVRGQSLNDHSVTPEDPDNILPRYDWQALPEREYSSLPPMKEGMRYLTAEPYSGGCGCSGKYREGYKSLSGDSSNPNGTSDKTGNKMGNWLIFGIIGIVAVVAIFLLIYGMHRNHSISQSLQTPQVAVLSPQYVPSSMKPKIS
jgi:hypothetical protein